MNDNKFVNEVEAPIIAISTPWKLLWTLVQSLQWPRQPRCTASGKIQHSTLIDWAHSARWRDECVFLSAAYMNQYNFTVWTSQCEFHTVILHFEGFGGRLIRIIFESYGTSLVRTDVCGAWFRKKLFKSTVFDRNCSSSFYGWAAFSAWQIPRSSQWRK